jgi:hypothetical protein
MARSLLFNMLFYVTTALFVVLGSPLLFGPRRWAMAALAIHGRFELWLLKVIVGTKLEVRGDTNGGIVANLALKLLIRPAGLPRGHRDANLRHHLAGPERNLVGHGAGRSAQARSSVSGVSLYRKEDLLAGTRTRDASDS